MHQRSFTKQMLTKHGIDRTSKPMTVIQMGNPDPSDTAPTAKQLRELQAYAGEFNWLATRTRGELAYYTSVIASTSTRFAAFAAPSMWEYGSRQMGIHRR